MATSKSTSGSERPQVLVVDDDVNMCEMLAIELETRGYAVDCRTSARAALAQFDGRENYATVVTDLNLGDESGLELCRELGAHDPTLPVVLITGFGTIEAAVRAIRLGAYDFVTKPFDFDSLSLTLERAVKHRSLQQEVRQLKKQLADGPPSFGELIGKSPPMVELFRVLRLAADSNATALIMGESGVGKELVARALHREGLRRDAPFVAVSCGALPATLLESELFGHVKGAFTDARSDRAGVFREAQGGTLFLDEIGELPMALQPKLLRVLQERTVRPLGGNKEIPVDVRIVCATNVNLHRAVKQGRFRQDLFYRLDVTSIQVPPLRRRGTDIVLLAEAFLEQAARHEGRPTLSLSAAVAERLLSYDWPGNVRELHNLAQRFVAIARGPVMGLNDLPAQMRPAPLPLPAPLEAPGSFPSLDEVERKYIRSVVDALKGNKRRAAAVLGLDRSTLYRKLQ